jgi:transposase
VPRASIERGYGGSVVQLRRVAASLRPARQEAFLRLRTFPGEQAQVDWAYCGEVAVGRARQRRVPLTLIESALLLASLRRLLRPADSPPLSLIRSLAYFQPVIEELLYNPVPDSYL